MVQESPMIILAGLALFTISMTLSIKSAAEEAGQGSAVFKFGFIKTLSLGFIKFPTLPNGARSLSISVFKSLDVFVLVIIVVVMAWFIIPLFSKRTKNHRLVF
jgi:hypothetical protein